MLSGSVVLLSGSGLVTAISFAYNIAVARFLGPDGFGDATAVYTLLTLLSAATLSFQLISSKIVAQQESLEGKYAGYRGFHRAAWGCSIFGAFLLVVFRTGISNYLNLSDPMLAALLAIGVAFYVPLGCRRGYLLGTYGFGGLAWNLVLEGALRLVGSLLLIWLGLGVRGVILANSAAVAVSYFAVIPKRAGRAPNPVRLGRAMSEISQGFAFYAGQVLINNCDIVLVKHFFVPEVAGLYAAVAMVGRVIYSFSQAVVNSMFPLVAGTQSEERKDLKVIGTSLLLVLSIGSTLALVLRFAPAWVWTDFFGAGFQIAGKYNFPYLLALYAITTVIYSLSAVIITYEMSYKISSASWIQLVFSGVVIAGIYYFHASLREVILVQLVLMLALLLVVTALFLSDSLSISPTAHLDGIQRPLRVLRHVSEDEIIAEFLKSDFGSPIFDNYQKSLRDIVVHPDLDNIDQCTKRRALFFLRHGALWNELPGGTEWYEMELREADLSQVRVFPRAQWRKFAKRNFSILQIADYLRDPENAAEGAFVRKIATIGEMLAEGGGAFGPVLLIGVSESDPLTILDGNHRLVSAIMASPSQVYRLRFLCGLSPRMTECCWYNTNLFTLLRYGRNVVASSVRRRKAEMVRLLQSPG